MAAEPSRAPYLGINIKNLRKRADEDIRLAGMRLAFVARAFADVDEAVVQQIGELLQALDALKPELDHACARLALPPGQEPEE
jgi:hypothetical protein